MSFSLRIATGLRCDVCRKELDGVPVFMFSQSAREPWGTDRNFINMHETCFNKQLASALKRVAATAKKEAA